MPHTFQLRRHPHLPLPPTLRAVVGAGGIHALEPGVLGENLIAGVAGPLALTSRAGLLAPLHQREGEPAGESAWQWEVQSGGVQGRWAVAFSPEELVLDFEVTVHEPLAWLTPLAVPVWWKAGHLLTPGEALPVDLADRRLASRWFEIGDRPAAWALNSQGGYAVIARQANRPFGAIRLDRLGETLWRVSLAHRDLAVNTKVEGRVALRVVPFNGAVTLDRVLAACAREARASESVGERREGALGSWALTTPPGVAPSSAGRGTPIPGLSAPTAPEAHLEDDGSLTVRVGGNRLRVIATAENKPLARKHVEDLSLTVRETVLSDQPVWEVTLRLRPVRALRALRLDAELATPCGNPTWHGDATVVIPGNFARCNYHPDHDHGGGPKWGPSPVPVEEPRVRNAEAPGCCHGWTFAGSRLPQVWAAAADRRAGKLVWIGTTPRSVLGENCAGFVSPAGQTTTLRIATPTTYEPWVPLGYSRMRPEARRDTAPVAEGEEVIWTLWVAVRDTEDLNAWGPLDRALYLTARPSEPTPVKLSIEEAARVCAGALHDHFFRTDPARIVYSTGPDGQSALLAFTGMAHPALVMLWAGQEFGESTWREAGAAVLDTCARMFLEGPGFPWTALNPGGGAGEVNPFGAGSGEPGYVVMVAFDNLAEALRRERAWGRDHPDWERALRRCAEHWVKNQSPEGAYPHWGPDFSPAYERNEYGVTNVEVGVIANMVDAAELLGDGQFLESAQRAAAFYGRHLDDGRLWGGPGDIRALVNSEVPMFMLRGFRRLFEATRDPEHRRLMLVAAAWRHLFQCAHSWPVEPGSPLWRQGWAGLGAESASACNLHTAAYGAINLPDEWALWRITGDPVHRMRCEDLARYTVQQYARFAGDLGFPFAGAGTESWWASDTVWGKGYPWIFTDPGFDLGFMAWITGWSGYGALWAREVGVATD